MANMLTRLLSRAGEDKSAGIVAKAASALEIDQQYKNHMADAIASDKEPMTKEDFIKSRGRI